MHDGRYGGGFLGHGRRPYRGRRRLPIAAWVLALLLPAGSAAAAPRPLTPGGAAVPCVVAVAGGEVVVPLTVVAGARYRLTVTPGTLARPVLALGRPGEEPWVRVDAGAGGGPAVHAWDAERDALLEARVGGFSAQTGRATIRLESLDLQDRPAPAHRRFLAPDPADGRARVGELLVGDANRWHLRVEPGRAYAIEPTRGSAGRVHLVVHGPDDAVLGDSAAGGSAWLAYPPVRFRVPPAAEGAPAPDVQLEVRSLLDGGGTYGLRMRALPDDATVEPAEVVPPAEVERGTLEGQPETFRAGPGDVAVVYVPQAQGRTRLVEMQRGDRWVRVEDMGLGSSARSQEDALLAWFQPYYPGTYRFRDPLGAPAGDTTLLLHDRAALGSAPIHMGTGADPSPRARIGRRWRLVGLGICMPGWDYLLVCVHAPDSGVAMRVRSPEGRTVATRSAGARTISPGLGPSLRFRVPAAGVYRLEVRSNRRQVVRPLLRRAAP